jgi:hypothetical protein
VRNERDKDKREELEAAGWRPEEREGETVWQHPESRLWYPEGVAIAMLREGADANVPLDAEGGTQASREASPERGSDRRPYEEPGPLR